MASEYRHAIRIHMYVGRLQFACNALACKRYSYLRTIIKLIRLKHFAMLYNEDWAII